MKKIIKKMLREMIENDRQDLIGKALEKAFFNDKTVETFNNGEDVLIKTSFFPKKEITGKIIKKTLATYTVMFNDGVKTIKKFSTKTLESTKEEEGFKYILKKINNNLQN